jgi:hypothetical protein
MAKTTVDNVNLNFIVFNLGVCIMRTHYLKEKGGWGRIETSRYKTA